jgi:hypothetical protein
VLQALGTIWFLFLQKRYKKIHACVPLNSGPFASEINKLSYRQRIIGPVPTVGLDYHTVKFFRNRLVIELHYRTVKVCISCATLQLVSCPVSSTTMSCALVSAVQQLSTSGWLLHNSNTPDDNMSSSRMLLAPEAAQQLPRWWLVHHSSTPNSSNSTAPFICWQPVQQSHAVCSSKSTSEFQLKASSLIHLFTTAMLRAAVCTWHSKRVDCQPLKYSSWQQQ